jgi:hypothetical protein
MGLIKLKFKLITYWKIKSSKKITAFKNFTKQKKKIKKIKKKSIMKKIYRGWIWRKNSNKKNIDQIGQDKKLNEDKIKRKI